MDYLGKNELLSAFSSHWIDQVNLYTVSQEAPLIWQGFKDKERHLYGSKKQDFLSFQLVKAPFSEKSELFDVLHALDGEKSVSPSKFIELFYVKSSHPGFYSNGLYRGVTANQISQELYVYLTSLEVGEVSSIVRLNFDGSEYLSILRLISRSDLAHIDGQFTLVSSHFDEWLGFLAELRLKQQSILYLR